MALSIHSNLLANTALRNLRSVGRLLTRSTVRMAEQRRITRAADDPSGLLFVARTRAQIQSLGRANQNSQLGINFLKTVDNALDQVGQRVQDIADAVVAGDQDSIDTALAAIDQITSSTTFAGTKPLRGASAIFPATPDARLRDLEVRRGSFLFNQAQGVTVEVTAAPTRGSFVFTAAGTSGPVELEVTGPLGSGTISLAGGEITPIDDLVGQLNVLKESIGLDETSIADDSVETLTFGSDSTITVRRVSGTGTVTLSGTAMANGDVLSFSGSDAGIRVNGRNAATVGDRVNFSSNQLAMRFRIDPTVVAGTAISISLAAGGETFQLGTEGLPTDRLTLGLPNVSTGSLGRTLLTDSGGTGYFGFLSSLASGGANDLASNPTNAARIADEAASQVSALRAFVGATISRNLEPNLLLTDKLAVELEDARSRVEDLDFAEEAANFTRLQVLFQAVTSVVAQANLFPADVARLLPFPSSS